MGFLTLKNGKICHLVIDEKIGKQYFYCTYIYTLYRVRQLGRLFFHFHAPPLFPISVEKQRSYHYFLYVTSADNKTIIAASGVVKNLAPFNKLRP